MPQVSPHSVLSLVDRIVNDPTLIAKMKEDPEGALYKVANQILREVTPSALESDKWVYRSVVWALGLTILIVVFGVTFWHSGGPYYNEAPQLLTAIGSTAVGALAGLLAPFPGSKK